MPTKSIDSVAMGKINKGWTPSSGREGSPREIIRDLGAVMTLL